WPGACCLGAWANQRRAVALDNRHGVLRRNIEDRRLNPGVTACLIERDDFFAASEEPEIGGSDVAAGALQSGKQHPADAGPTRVFPGENTAGSCDQHFPGANTDEPSCAGCVSEELAVPTDQDMQFAARIAVAGPGVPGTPGRGVLTVTKGSYFRVSVPGQLGRPAELKGWHWPTLAIVRKASTSVPEAILGWCYY